MLAKPAVPSAHKISAVGHAHIDSAWLWPLRETVRKVARTTANMTNLLDSEPEFIYTMSQAAQYDFIKTHRPEVYEKVKKAVADGRFVPAGGMWVESDTNMPGSEAMARQFVHGKRFFLEEFGVENDEAWLPDTFGFAGGLPQIIKAAGSKWLLTQKISWSQVNKFPHHTFLWEGIDGTRIFTHFPPIDTYNCSMKGSEIAHAARNFKDKGRASVSLAPTGWGDGGGGTTREMVAKAKRMKDLEGSAKVAWEKPADFFAKAEAEYQNPPVWVGELYLELHRATLTSQAKTKQGNRSSEQPAARGRAVGGDGRGAGRVSSTRTTSWTGPGRRCCCTSSTTSFPVRRSPGCTARRRRRTSEVAEDPDQPDPRRPSRRWPARGRSPMRAARWSSTARRTRSTESPAGGAGAQVRAGGPGRRLGPGRRRPRARQRPGPGRDRRPRPGGLHLRPRTGPGDRPAGRRGEPAADPPGLPEHVGRLGRRRVLPQHRDGPDRGRRGLGRRHAARRSVRASRAPLVRRLDGPADSIRLDSGSKAVQFATEVDWHETEKFLKLAFPMDIHADRYASETQFGHIYRPTHTNTSWEAAKFEACNHGFLHFEEPGFGVAILSGSTYGHDVTRTVRPDGGTTVTARVSLLRAPRFPDPETDQGEHVFHHALAPGAAIGDAVREARLLNPGLRPVLRRARHVVEPLFTIDDDAVTASAIKLADDRSGDVVLRVYETHGGRASALITPNFGFSGFEICDLLERPITRGGVTVAADNDGLRLRLRPFQLVTLRFARTTGSEA